jgi:CrcB protein
VIVAMIVIGGGLGAVLRWLVTVWFGSSEAGFPIGTAFVNVAGSLALGLVYGLNFSVDAVDIRPLTIGLLGGFTTFSTWMVQIDGAPSSQMGAKITVVPGFLGIVGAATGLVLGRFIVG